MHFLSSLAVLLGASAVTAMTIAERRASSTPDVAKILPNMHVLIKNIDGSYAHSEEMADQIRTRSGISLFGKRTTATVQACYDSGCSNCHQVFTGTIDGNSGCISAENTQCLIISDLEDANIEFWNKGGCNGNNSVYRGCGKASANVGASGTNSIGVHTGC